MKLKMVHRRDASGRGMFKSLGEDMIAEERASEEELSEIHKLKDESMSGMHVEWGKLKKELSL
ncbi:MAG: hypothetical protein C4B59_07450 [Candidatus Methanogaster sp.]|uniref:Uncharacterized protein n=1 Tax=Candidatus Methanogaster sp. TaxID=3386292 RepID=A0AC61L3A2_9EURY|nr:MAG: hypothetical protein C4B59_07450 [ANME-2 cluster archaeon]